MMMSRLVLMTVLALAMLSAHAASEFEFLDMEHQDLEAKDTKSLQRLGELIAELDTKLSQEKDALDAEHQKELAKLNAARAAFAAAKEELDASKKNLADVKAKYEEAVKTLGELKGTLAVFREDRIRMLAEHAAERAVLASEQTMVDMINQLVVTVNNTDKTAAKAWGTQELSLVDLETALNALANPSSVPAFTDVTVLTKAIAARISASLAAMDELEKKNADEIARLEQLVAKWEKTVADLLVKYEAAEKRYKKAQEDYAVAKGALDAQEKAYAVFLKSYQAKINLIAREKAGVQKIVERVKAYMKEQ